MARRQTYSSTTEEPNVAHNASYSGRTNMDAVRIDGRTFESPRGRGRNNPGWGRVDGMPFISPRGRGRRIPLETRSQDFNTTGDATYACTDMFHPNQRIQQHSPDSRPVQQFTAPDGTSYHSGLVRLDDRPFESPRGRGRNNPGWGRSDGRPFVSQRGQIAHQRRSAQYYYAPSAPTYDDIMDDGN